MCEATVYLEQSGQRQKVLENVARVELTGDGVVLRKLFEPPLTIRAMIREIDFLKHSVTLAAPDEIPAVLKGRRKDYGQKKLETGHKP